MSIRLENVDIVLSESGDVVLTLAASLLLSSFRQSVRGSKDDAELGRTAYMTLVTQREIDSHVLSLETIFDCCAESLEGSPLVVSELVTNSERHVYKVLFPNAQALRYGFGLPSKDLELVVTRTDCSETDQEIEIQNQSTTSMHIPLSTEDLLLWHGIMRHQLTSVQQIEKQVYTPKLVYSFLQALLASLQQQLLPDDNEWRGAFRKLLTCFFRACSLCEDYQAVNTLCKVHRGTLGDADAEWFEAYSMFKLEAWGDALPLFESCLRRRWTGDPCRQSFPIEECIVSCCQSLQQDVSLPPLKKFPRTPHLFHPSGSKAVAPDDEVLKDSIPFLDLGNTTSVILQEKIDGSNLGLTLSLDGTEILAHNRSHYLRSGEHQQYSPLHAWIALHRESLIRILQRPSQWVLYGEWMVARHSVPYNRLPGFFVAFDLYDIKARRFVSQDRLRHCLSGSNIPIAPSLGPLTLTENWKEELLGFLYANESKFRSDGGPMEGLVLRVESDGYLVNRSKLVRPDFEPGTGWSKSNMERQAVDHSFAELYTYNETTRKAPKVNIVSSTTCSIRKQLE